MQEDLGLFAGARLEDMYDGVGPSSLCLIAGWQR